MMLCARIFGLDQWVASTWGAYDLWSWRWGKKRQKKPSRMVETCLSASETPHRSKSVDCLDCGVVTVTPCGLGVIWAIWKVIRRVDVLVVGSVMVPQVFWIVLWRFARFFFLSRGNN